MSFRCSWGVFLSLLIVGQMSHAQEEKKVDISTQTVVSSEVVPEELRPEQLQQHIEETLEKFEQATERSIEEPHRNKIIQFLKNVQYGYNPENFRYEFNRFFQHNVHKNASIALDGAVGLATTHVIETSGIFIYTAMNPELPMLLDASIRFILGAITIPLLVDPLCIGFIWRYKKSEGFRKSVRAYRMVIMRGIAPAIQYVGQKLSMRFVDQVSKGQLFQNLKQSYESQFLVREYIHDRQAVRFGVKDFSGKELLALTYSQSNGDYTKSEKMILNRIEITNVEGFKKISPKNLSMLVADFEGNLNHLLKKYQKVVIQNKPENIQKDFSCKQLTITEDGRVLVDIKKHAVTLKKFVPQFDAFFYSNDYSKIKHQHGVDLVQVKEAQMSFWSGLTQFFLSRSAPATGIEFQKFVNKSLESSIKWMNFDTAVFFLGQAFDGSSQSLFGKEKAFELKSRLGIDAYQKVESIIQQTFFEQLLVGKDVASYFHASKALVSDAVLPDNTRVRDLAFEALQKQMYSPELKKGFSFSIQALKNLIAISGQNVHERWTEFDNILYDKTAKGLKQHQKIDLFKKQLNLLTAGTADQTLRVNTSVLKQLVNQAFALEAFHFLENYYFKAKQGDILVFALSEVRPSQSLDVIDYAVKHQGYRIPEVHSAKYYADKSIGSLQALAHSSEYHRQGRQSSLVRTQDPKNMNLTLEAYRSQVRKLMRAKFWRKTLKL